LQALPGTRRRPYTSVPHVQVHCGDLVRISTLNVPNRYVLHVSKDHPVNITLKTIIEKNFPEEYKQRLAEIHSENSQTEDKQVVHF